MKYLITVLMVGLFTILAEAQQLATTCTIDEVYECIYERQSDISDKCRVFKDTTSPVGFIRPVFYTSKPEVKKMSGQYFEMFQQGDFMDDDDWTFTAKTFVKTYEAHGFINHVWENGHTKDQIVVSYWKDGPVAVVRTKPAEGAGIMCTCK